MRNSVRLKSSSRARRIATWWSQHASQKPRRSKRRKRFRRTTPRPKPQRRAKIRTPRSGVGSTPPRRRRTRSPATLRSKSRACPRNAARSLSRRRNLAKPKTCGATASPNSASPTTNLSRKEETNRYLQNRWRFLFFNI